MTELKSCPTALSIAGSDSGGGAGIQADLKTFSALGVYGMSAITALTAQNTCEVKSVLDVSPRFLGEQIDAVFEDFQIQAIKIGMLNRAEIIEVVADRLSWHGAKNIVLDPVMVSKSGATLLQKNAISVLKKKLIPLSTILTPNLPEASILLGRLIQSREEMEHAAAELLNYGARSVIVKGGHSKEAKNSADCFVNNENRGAALWLDSPRIETKNTHGTGCTFSAAIAAFLARSLNISTAVTEAKSYLTHALREGEKFRIGRKHGPVHHFYKFFPVSRVNRF